MTADVVSPLLSDPKPEPVKPAREVDPDFAATVAAGYVETDVDAWYATVRRIPADWQQRLALAAVFAHVLLAHRVAQIEAQVKEARR